MGPNITSATLAEVMSAAAEIDPELPWPDVAARIIPLLERARPFPPGYPTPVRTLVPPGVSINLGIDVGPAVMHVDQALVDRWRMSVSDLAARSLANLQARARGIAPGDVLHQPVNDVQVAVLQTGLSIGSTLVLVPHELARIFGPQPRMFVAPMRDLLLAVPPDELDLAIDLFVSIASEDPNCLQPRAYRFEGESVRVTQLG